MCVPPTGPQLQIVLLEVLTGVLGTVGSWMAWYSFILTFHTRFVSPPNNSCISYKSMPTSNHYNRLHEVVTHTRAHPHTHTHMVEMIASHHEWSDALHSLLDQCVEITVVGNDCRLKLPSPVGVLTQGNVKYLLPPIIYSPPLPFFLPFTGDLLQGRKFFFFFFFLQS